MGFGGWQKAEKQETSLRQNTSYLLIKIHIGAGGFPYLTFFRPKLPSLKCKCVRVWWEVKLSVTIIFQLCIPAVDDKNPDKELMLLRKHNSSMKNQTFNYVVKIYWYSHLVLLMLFNCVFYTQFVIHSTFDIFGCVFKLTGDIIQYRRGLRLVDRFHTYVTT